ncbi:MAG: nitrogenase component 1 [Methanoregula sp.]|nr:nitrogenase component 1 [Methanoregula sp.]
MTLKPSQSNSCRYGGCTLTGALSVTTHVRDAVTVVHGPAGCTHHNFSLFHATSLDNDAPVIPNLVSTGLSETDIIFGGEPALDRTLDSVLPSNPGVIFVLSTCVVDTIGDDIAMVCGKERGVPVVPVPTAGFIGGTFEDGVNKALIALAGMAEGSRGTNARRAGTLDPVNHPVSANIIGEKNLEYELVENYTEVNRLLSAIGCPVNCRFVHDLTSARIATLGDAQVNILRDPALVPVGEYLKKRFKTPYIRSFPIGLGSPVFLETVAEVCGAESRDAVARELALQVETLGTFADLRGSTISFAPALVDPKAVSAAKQLARALDMPVRKNGLAVPLPTTPPVGIAGVRRLLHRWRRAIHA